MLGMQNAVYLIETVHAAPSAWQSGSFLRLGEHFLLPLAAGPCSAKLAPADNQMESRLTHSN